MNRSTRVMITAAAVLTVIAPAGAHAATAEASPAEPATLAGTCVTSGRIDFAEAMGPAGPQTNRFSYVGTGTCFGAAGGQTLPDSGAPATMTMKGSTVGSCPAGTFTDGPIRLTIDVPNGRPVQVEAQLKTVVAAVRDLSGSATFAQGGGAPISGRFQGDMRAPRACLEGRLRSTSASFEIGPVNVDPLSALPKA